MRLINVRAGFRYNLLQTKGILMSAVHTSSRFFGGTYMRRYFYSIIASAVLLLAAVGASAQVGQLRGHVFIQQADGTKVPAAGAQVDVYRTDLPGKFPSKANKNGEFVYAGLPYVGTYVIAVSAPNASPTVRGGVKVGRDIDFELVMTPGNGQRFTEEQAKAGGGGTETAGPSSGESAADKAKREAMEKKNAEITEANKKIENANQVIGDSFKGGKYCSDCEELRRGDSAL